jgi:transcription initiation factor TFIIIB Brf1 subunit/transcription initiation factor TFIIB
MFCDACKKKNCVLTMKNKDEVCILCGIIHKEAGVKVEDKERKRRRKRRSSNSFSTGLMARLRKGEEVSQKQKFVKPELDPDDDEYISFA